MHNLGRIIPKGLAMLMVSFSVACGAAPTAPPENTVPAADTPAGGFQQRPSLPAPALEGAVETGGGTLRYQCFGEGAPAVIVEAGGGDKPTLTLSWNAVIQGVYPVTRICIYDRAAARTSRDMAENLHALLGKIPVPGPYILIAHSLGGWHARVFAHLYPEEMAGMILVDTTLTAPDAPISYATAYPTYSPDEPADITHNRLPVDGVLSGTLLPSFDGLDMEASNRQVREAGSFGDLPLVVISQTPGPEDFPGVDPVAQKQLSALILKIQSDLTALSTKGVFMAAKTSDHFISLYEPQIIIDAAVQMVREIRKQADDSKEPQAWMILIGLIAETAVVALSLLLFVKRKRPGTGSA